MLSENQLLHDIILLVKKTKNNSTEFHYVNAVSTPMCRNSIREIPVEIQNQHMNKTAYEWDDPNSCF